MSNLYTPTALAIEAAREFTRLIGSRAIAWRNYIITTGTGDGVFLYRASDALDALNIAEAEAEESGAGIADYNIFCGEASPVESIKLARAIDDELDLLICHGGSCTPVITR